MKRDIQKLFCLVVVFFALLASCRKQENYVNTDQLGVNREKVEVLLMKYRDSNELKVSQGINLLLKALDFSNIKKSVYSVEEDLWIVPMSTSFSMVNDSHDRGFYNLVIFANKLGTIRVAKIVKYIPYDNKEVYTPENAFHDYYTFKPTLNAKFEFYNIYGKKFESFDYKDGVLKAHSMVKTKEEIFSNSKQTLATSSNPDPECTDYYDVYEFYDNDGNLLTTDTIYAYTICRPTFGSWQSELDNPNPGENNDPYFNDPRRVTATITRVIPGVRGSGWTLYITDDFKGIKDPVNPNSNYFYGGWNTAVNVQNPNPDNYEWDGVVNLVPIGPSGSPSTIGATQRIQSHLQGTVTLPFPWNQWVLGTSQQPMIYNYYYNQVFP